MTAVGRDRFPAPFLAIALLSMVWGTSLGLLRLGWPLPLPWPDQLIAHGPLMVGAFVGTLISLERAVALASPWGYSAPLLTASGGIFLIFGPPIGVGSLLIMIGSATMVGISAAIWRREPSLVGFTQLLGVVAWFIGNAQWFAGRAIFRVVFWWLAFLVLTIGGERLELNRVKATHVVGVAFVVAITVVMAGVVLATYEPMAGVRIMGAGLLLMTCWILRNDIARRLLLQRGLRRFTGVSVLSASIWLAIGGTIALVTGASTPGTEYDAILHAVFLGFMVSMMFGQAPLMLETVLHVRPRYHPAYYLHLSVLQGSLALRVVGDLVESLGRWRAYGGALNGLSLLLFIVNTAWSATRAPR